MVSLIFFGMWLWPMYLCIAVGLVAWAYRRCDETPLMPLSVGTIAIPVVFVVDLLTGFLLSGWFGMTVMVFYAAVGSLTGVAYGRHRSRTVPAQQAPGQQTTTQESPA